MCQERTLTFKDMSDILSVTTSIAITRERTLDSIGRRQTITSKITMHGGCQKISGEHEIGIGTNPTDRKNLKGLRMKKRTFERESQSGQSEQHGLMNLHELRK